MFRLAEEVTLRPVPEVISVLPPPMSMTVAAAIPGTPLMAPL